MSVTVAAEQSGVSRVTLSRLLNGKAAVSAEMAIRLSQWLDGNSEVRLLELLQYDLWYARTRAKIKMEPAAAAAKS